MQNHCQVLCKNNLLCRVFDIKTTKVVDVNNFRYLFVLFGYKSKIHFAFYYFECFGDGCAYYDI